MKKIIVNTSDGKYPIYIGNGLSNYFGNFLRMNNLFPSKVLLVIDDKLPKKMVKKIKESYKKKMKSVHGDVKTVNKTGIAKLNRTLRKKGEITSDDFEDVGYKKIELKPGRKPPVIQKKW